MRVYQQQPFYRHLADSTSVCHAPKNYNQCHHGNRLIDPGFSLEEIHEMLDGIERSLSRLKAANLPHDKHMPMAYIPEAVSVFMEFDMNGVLPNLGINPSVANKLKNIDARLRAP